MTDNDDQPIVCWNPLTDHNHWRQIEERLRDNWQLQQKFFANFMLAGADKGLMVYLEADLRTRCEVLLETLASPSSK